MKHSKSALTNGFNYGTTSKSGFATTAGTEKPSIHVHKVSEAREFESFRHIPKYTKPFSALINPASPKKKPLTKKMNPDLEIAGSPARIAKRERIVKEIPEHLIKPPIDSTPRPPRKAKSNQKGIKGSKNKLEQ